MEIILQRKPVERGETNLLRRRQWRRRFGCSPGGLPYLRERSPMDDVGESPFCAAQCEASGGASVDHPAVGAGQAEPELGVVGAHVVVLYWRRHRTKLYEEDWDSCLRQTGRIMVNESSGRKLEAGALHYYECSSCEI